MGDKPNDANTGEQSSTSPDEMGASSAQDSVETSKGDVANQSLSDYLSTAVDVEKLKDGAEESDVVDQKEESSDVQKLNKTDEEKDGDSEKKKEPEKKEDVENEDDSSEEKSDEGKDRTAEGRIKELVTQKNEAVELFEAVKPKVENYDRINTFCQEHAITPEQFNQALEVQALLNSNPAEALKKLLPIVESLQGFVGEKLPPDLQSKVDSGKMELDDAKEFAKLRAERDFGSKKQVHDQQRMAASQQQQVQREMATSFSTWDSTKRATDPDYKPKAKESDPDGKWEFVKDKYLARLNETKVVNGQVVHANPIRTPQEMLALIERSYNEVSSSMTHFGGRKPATRKTLPSNGSSQSTTKKSFENAGSMKELADMVLPNRR